MRLTRARDDVAFTEFAGAVAPRLFRSALLLCGDWHLAEDLVQTTLGKLYIAWPKVERADSAEAYAHGTLTKTFLSHKRLRRNTEVPVLEPLNDPIEDGSDPTLRLELFEALGSLEAADRAVIVLRYWNDQSVAQTARHTGLSQAAVRTRASRALARLRTQLAEGSANNVEGSR